MSMIMTRTAVMAEKFMIIKPDIRTLLISYAFDGDYTTQKGSKKQSGAGPF